MRCISEKLPRFILVPHLHSIITAQLSSINRPYIINCISFISFFINRSLLWKTMEPFLKNLGYEPLIDTFKKNEVDIRLLVTLSENDIKETLKELALPVGVRMRILQEIKLMKERGK